MGQGQSGPQGPSGLQGPRGDPGLQGPPGKDATVDLKQVSDSIIVNKTFQNQFVPLVSKDDTLATNVSKQVANDTTFSNSIINSMAADTRFKGPPADSQEVATLLGNDTTFPAKLAPFVTKDAGFLTNVGQQLVQNNTFSNNILGTMATDPRFKGPKGNDSSPQDVATTLSKDSAFTTSVSQQVTQNNAFSNNIINTIATDERFKGKPGKDADVNINATNLPLLTEKLVASNTFLNNLAPVVANNNQLGQNIATNLTNNLQPRTLITNAIINDQNYRNTLINAMAADTRFRGAEGKPGSALDTNSLRITVEPRSLWCADGQMCKTPIDSPGTMITGDLVIGNNVVITQGNRLLDNVTRGSLKIGTWTISENTTGDLQFSKNNFTNGNVIFEAGKTNANQMSVSTGNFIAGNDLKSNYAYIDSAKINTDLNIKNANITNELTIDGWKTTGGVDFYIYKPDKPDSTLRINGGGNSDIFAGKKKIN